MTDTLPTTDLCDRYADQLQIAEPLFGDFGGRLAFAGPISTVKCFEDNSLVRAALEEPGQGRVLVVDGGASDRCALLGDNLAQLAIDNDWAGIVVYGCIRDSADIGEMDVAVKALATHPLKSNKRDLGDRDVLVRFAGVAFRPGAWIYGDADGMVVAAKELSL
ncbi:MAG: ribonuclease E activity regulator RraA [Salinisphaeraceae bacterium]